MVKPVLQALLVADHVYTDAASGKKVVAGIFSTMLFRKPVEEVNPPREGPPNRLRIDQRGHVAGSPFCYIGLVDVHGEQHFDLRYVDLSDDKVLIETRFGVMSQDPVRVVEIVIPMPPLPTDKPGTFALELLWNNEPLGAHRIIVQEMNEGANPDGK